MQRQVNRLQKVMLAAANAKASLEEIRKSSEEDKAVWQRESEEMQQVNRLREANASLEEVRVQQNDHINKLLNADKMRAKQVTQELGLLEQEPAAPSVEQVERLASKNAKASLEEIRNKCEEEKAVWQREKEEMQRQLNRLQEELLATANAKASLEEICQTALSSSLLLQREMEEMQHQVNRLREEVLAATNANAWLGNAYSSGWKRSACSKTTISTSCSMQKR